MANKLPKKHFHFPDFGDANKATAMWWKKQDERGVDHTSFNISADGSNTNLCISDQSLADQPKFIDFLAINFAGKYTVHDTQQVRTWLDDVFGG